MTAPTIYRSDDASAPTINGVAGSLVAALYAILVTGYGAKTGAGWARPYTGTDKAAFQQGAGLSQFLRVDDTDARLARVVGYATMSDVDTGTNPHPTSGQISGGLYCRKSVTAASTARPWICLANDSAFYLFVFGNRTGALSTAGFDGGDSHLGYGTLVAERVSGDINKNFICAGSDTSATSTTSSDARQCLSALATAAQATLYTNGSYDQGSSTSATANKRGFPFLGLSNAQSGLSAGVPYPDPITGDVLLCPMTLVESVAITPRGDLPGIRALGHLFSGAGMGPTLSLIQGRGRDTGNNFLLIGTGSNSGVAFALGDWDG